MNVHYNTSNFGLREIFCPFPSLQIFSTSIPYVYRSVFMYACAFPTFKPRVYDSLKIYNQHKLDKGHPTRFCLLTVMECTRK